MRAWMGIGLLALGAVTAACSSEPGGPTSPSAANGSLSAAADGSTLKAAPPRLVSPIGGVTAGTTATLITEPAVGKYASIAATTARFQVSESADFSGLTDEGTGTAPANGLITYRIQRAQRTGIKVYWRARAEFQGAFGPWSAPAEFIVSGSVVTPSPTGGQRTPNPPAGQRLPLPNMEAQIRQWTADRPDLFPAQQCPLGVKYVNNPWQDYIVDKLRQIDTRWGYNAKPNRTPADNGGRAVVAAGDEILYNWGSNADEGNTTEVYAVDMLTGHCGTPVISWRVFTGEEPVRWTGAGRF